MDLVASQFTHAPCRSLLLSATFLRCISGKIPVRLHRATGGSWLLARVYACTVRVSITVSNFACTLTVSMMTSSFLISQHQGVLLTSASSSFSLLSELIPPSE